MINVMATYAMAIAVIFLVQYVAELIIAKNHHSLLLIRVATMVMSAFALTGNFGGNILLAVIGFVFSAMTLSGIVLEIIDDEFKPKESMPAIIIEIFNIAIGVLLIVLR